MAMASILMWEKVPPKTQLSHRASILMPLHCLPTAPGQLSNSDYQSARVSLVHTLNKDKHNLLFRDL